MSTPNYTGNFKVEYAKSAKSKCFACKQQVDKDELRIGAVVQSDKFDGTYPQWHHETCFEDSFLLKNPGMFDSAAKVSGMNELKYEDQKKIVKLIKTGGEEDAASEASGSEDSELERAIEAESKKLWQTKERIKHLTMKQMKDLLEYNDQPCTGKIFGGEATCRDRIADGMLFGALPKCTECDEGDLRFTGSEYKCTGNIDGYTKCNNVLKEVERGKWNIPATLKYEDGLSNYVFKAPKKPRIVHARDVEKRKREDSDSETEKEGDDSSDDSNPKAKKQKVAADKAKVTAKKPKKPCFAGLTVGCSGKLKGYSVAKLQKVIEDNGGTYSKTAKCDYLVTTAAEAKAKKTKKTQEAASNDVIIVDEEWVEISTKAGAVPKGDELEEVCYENMPEETEREKRKRLADEADIERKRKELEDDMDEKYTEATSAPVGGKQTLRIKGGVAVDPASGLTECARVLVEGKATYTVTMNRVDIASGKNSYYILQLIKYDDKKQWCVFRKWGKVGTTIGDKKSEDFPLLSAAKREFAKVFLDKTGNAWDDYLDGEFEKKPGLMEVVDISYGDEKKLLEQQEKKNKKYEGDLHETTQELLRNIFDIRAMEACLVEMEIDTSKLPLGNLSKATLKKGLQALTNIQKFLKETPDVEGLDDDSRRKVEAKLVGLSNQFYTKVPLNFDDGVPEVLDTLEKVKEKNNIVSNLLDMELAAQIINDDDEDGTHPIDQHYKKLKCDFTVVPKKSKIFKTVYKYLQNTHADTHDMYTMELEALWEIDREGEATRFVPFEKDKNRKLLWHGSRITNWGGILSQGLRIAPPEAPTTGYMFGKGVYFADMSSKSANYCYTTSEKTTGVMVLCEVALGDMKECREATYIEKLPKGKLSCFGAGAVMPDPAEDVEMDNGCIIPSGKPVKVLSGDETSLKYNEFIVYDVDQVRMKYLLQVKFHYNKTCGTFF